MTQIAFQHNLPEYSVTEIAGALKRTVEDKFGFVRVRGEVSGWKGVHSSGHAYFRMKDNGAVLDAVCWRGSIGKLGCKLEEGLEIIATGRITTYPGKSSYQLIIERAEPAGIGALMALLEKRKAQLAQEGLFAEERKKPIPYFPQCIGVVTSPTGAVIRDILHRLKERFPCHIVVWPVAVQGEVAAEQIAAAIDGFNMGCSAHPKPDVLIVARGGGSIEDLWAFNEEIVVRAAANSRIPLISAVGHETDTTLIDFASDKRAPTPTAAAEMASPVREELLLYTHQLEQRLMASMLRTLTSTQEQLQGLARGLPKPAQFLENAEQRLDDWTDRLSSALPSMLEKKQQQLALHLASLKPQLLIKDIDQWSRRLTDMAQRLQPPLKRLLEIKEQKLQLTAKLLASMSYESALARGFAIIRKEDGALIRSAEAAKAEQRFNITFNDGSVAVAPTSKLDTI